MNEDLIQEELVDPEFSVDACTCGTCRVCITRDIRYQETLECICTYKEEVVQQPSCDEEGNEIIVDVPNIVVDVKCERCKEIDKLTTILDKYDLLESASIPEEEWTTCIVHEGMIFRSQADLDKYLSPDTTTKNLYQRVEELEGQTEMNGAIIDDLLFEVIPSIESRMPNVTKTIQTRMAAFNLPEIRKGENPMAVALAKGIMRGKDYATVFRCISYQQYQDEVDAILVMEGYGYLIVR